VAGSPSGLGLAAVSLHEMMAKLHRRGVETTTFEQIVDGLESLVQSLGENNEATQGNLPFLSDCGILPMSRWLAKEVRYQCEDSESARLQLGCSFCLC
jgi:hypothetical protein